MDKGEHNQKVSLKELYENYDPGMISQYLIKHDTFLSDEKNQKSQLDFKGSTDEYIRLEVPTYCVELSEFEDWYEKQKNTIQFSHNIGDAKISTIFLGNHDYATSGKKVALFETIVTGGLLDGKSIKSDSYEDAQMQFQAMCGEVESEIEKGMMFNYILIDRKPVRELDYEKFVEWHSNKDNWLLFVEEINDNIKVSTIFLAKAAHEEEDIKHLLLFETFVEGGPLAGESIRAYSWDGAKLLHDTMVHKVNDALKYLSKFSSNLLL